jgi:regulatory protein
VPHPTSGPRGATPTGRYATPTRDLAADILYPGFAAADCVFAVLALLPTCLYAPCMRSRFTPRKLESEQELYASALRALMRRAYSVYEMREYLARRCDEKDPVSVVVARLRENKYLDDGRYALEYARQHAHARRQGRYRIARELRGRGVMDQHIDAALEAIFAETDEALLVRVRIRRKLSNLRGPVDEKKLASLYRSLMAAGFSADTIRAEIRSATSAAPPDFADAASATDAEAE